MSNGSFTIVEQVGSKGYFAKVCLAVEAIELFTCEIMTDHVATCEWAIGATFGITHAWEIYLLTKPLHRGLKVNILEIQGHVCDTTNLVVAYASAMALWSALDWCPKKPLSFDPKTGFFGFWKY